MRKIFVVLASLCLGLGVSIVAQTHGRAENYRFDRAGPN